MLSGSTSDLTECILHLTTINPAGFKSFASTCECLCRFEGNPHFRLAANSTAPSKSVSVDAGKQIHSHVYAILRHKPRHQPGPEQQENARQVDREGESSLLLLFHTACKSILKVSFNIDSSFDSSDLLLSFTQFVSTCWKSSITHCSSNVNVIDLKPSHVRCQHSILKVLLICFRMHCFQSRLCTACEMYFQSKICNVCPFVV